MPKLIQLRYQSKLIKEAIDTIISNSGVYGLSQEEVNEIVMCMQLASRLDSRILKSTLYKELSEIAQNV